MVHIKDIAHLGAKCIIGTAYDDSIPEDEIKVTLIATGFEAEEPKEEKIQELTIEKEDIDEPIG